MKKKKRLKKTAIEKCPWCRRPLRPVEGFVPMSTMVFHSERGTYSAHLMCAYAAHSLGVYPDGQKKGEMGSWV